MADQESSPQPSKRPLLQASKWLQVRVLLDPSEMDLLLTELSPFLIYVPGSLIARGQGCIEATAFQEVYRAYAEALAKGLVPPEASYRQLFSTLWTVSKELIKITPMGESQELIRPSQPVIQLRPHRFAYSPNDGQFRSMVLGGDSISWGIQLSYPQIVQEPVTHEIETVTETARFPNTALFHQLQRWIRDHTIPTPFIVDHKRTNVPIRIGTYCLPWINRHPELQEQGIRVLEGMKGGGFPPC